MQLLHVYKKYYKYFFKFNATFGVFFFFENLKRLINGYTSSLTTSLHHIDTRPFVGSKCVIVLSPPPTIPRVYSSRGPHTLTSGRPALRSSQRLRYDQIVLMIFNDREVVPGS